MRESGDDEEVSDLGVLRSACSESRAVLDEQLQKLADIGDKAIWTVRSSVLVLGLLVSAASLGDAETLRELPAPSSSSSPPVASVRCSRRASTGWARTSA